MKAVVSAVGLTLALIYAEAAASDWKALETGPELEVSVDMQSIAVTDQNYRKAWVRYVFSEPQVIDQGFPAAYMVAVSLEYADCRSNSMSMGRTVLYADKLQQKQIKEANPKGFYFVEPPPDSFGETLHRIICTKPLKKK